MTSTTTATITTTTRRRPLLVNIKLSERYDKQTHFAFTLGLRNKGYTKCLCGKLINIASPSLTDTDILTIHQVMRVITDTDVSETCLLCSSLILELISEMWRIEAAAMVGRSHHSNRQKPPVSNEGADD